MKMKLIILLGILYLCVLSFNAKSQDMKTYEKEWAEVAKFETDGLPKSMLEIVDKIYKAAETEGNSDQIIKAYIYKLKLKNAIEDDAFEDLLYELQDKVDNVSFPENALMHSMLAEMYWMYYQSNRWKFYNRTETANFEMKDIKTWDLNRLSDAVIKHYNKSLERSAGLQEIDLQKYKEVIYKGTMPKNLRPTLYDFLAHRAISFFTNTEISLSRPADMFQVKDAFCFADAKVFVKEDITSLDTLSLHYHAARVISGLLKFRLSKNNSDALIDLDLKRLDFFHSHSVHDLKDKLYLEALERMEKKFVEVPFSAEISFRIAKYYRNLANRYKPLDSMTNKYKFSYKKSLEICNRVIEKFPSSSGADKCKSLKPEILRHNLSFTADKIVAPENKFSIQVKYRNFNKLWIRVASIDRVKLKKIRDKQYGQKLFDKILSASDKVYEMTYDLPDDVDYQEHATEIILNKLPVGNYVIFASNNKDFSYDENLAAWETLTISSISYVQRTNQDGNLEFYVLDRNSGIPLPNVKVQTWHRKYNYRKRKHEVINLKKYTTNQDGYFVVPSADHPKVNNIYVDFTYGKDFLSSAGSYYTYDYDNSAKASTEVVLFTDRAIYRPGQTIYFKGITLRKNEHKPEILANYNVPVILYDANYQEITKMDLTTNEFGTFQGSFDIPLGLLTGQFRLYTTHGTKYLRVEEYKRPKFEVKIPAFEGNALLNDTVTVKGQAIAYAGSNITDAEVRYRVQRTPRWLGWWYCYFTPATIEIGNGVTTTNDKGEFEIDFEALPDLSFGKDENVAFNYKISVDVTDINGETRSTSSNISIGYRALAVDLQIPDMLNNQEGGEFNILTKNLNGQFLASSGQIVINQLDNPENMLLPRRWERPDKPLLTQAEWYEQYPNNAYADELEYAKMPIKKQVVKQTFNTKDSKKFAFSDIKNLPQGVYSAEITSEDIFGNAVKYKRFFKVYNPKSTKMPLPAQVWFTPLGNQYEVGENAQVLIGSSAKVKVLYQIEHQSKIIKTEWIELDNNQKLIEIPVKEEFRGGVSVHFAFVNKNRNHINSHTFSVPYSNKELKMSFETFRDKLQPGEEEEWRIKISGSKGDKVAAEMVATLYDASLDVFAQNSWWFSPYSHYSAQNSWQTDCFSLLSSSLLKINLDNSHYVRSLNYDYFNWFGFSYYSNYYRNRTYRMGSSVKSKSAKKGDTPSKNGRGVLEVVDGEAEMEMEMSGEAEMDEVIVAPMTEVNQSVPEKPEADFSEVKVRTNFNETAFFYPQLATNKDGDIIVKFTIPESLTRWRMMGFAHTKDLEYNFINNELITQKELMVIPNEPRFFRENDKMIFPVKIANVSESVQNGFAKLEFFDALTMKPIGDIIKDKEQQKFSVEAGGNVLLDWKLEIPEGYGAITYRIVAKAETFSDGEEKPLPVLTNRMLVTESLPLPIRSNETKNYTFEKLKNSGKSKTLRHHRLTLEFTSNPAWYAVQALPYLMEYPYECSEQTFSRYYANSLASHIANSDPKIERIFKAWKNTPDSEALKSNLEKNQELKSLLLEETPWVLNSQDEGERKRRVGLLFDLNRMAGELRKAMKKLQKSQSSNGGWPWFDGMPESRYITQHIVCGMGHLDNLGVKSVREDNATWQMLVKAVGYLDVRIKEDYKWLKRNYSKKELKENHLSQTAIQYLYARSYFTDIQIPNKTQEAFDYYKSQAEEYWLSQSKYMQGMIALGLHRYDEKKIPKKIVNSLREHSQDSDEMGMFWKDNVSGYYWYQAPIEVQALMVEVFDEVANDEKSVDALKVWLLKQKQTQDWKTTKATVEAVYALLLRGDNWLTSDELVQIKLGDMDIDPNKMDDVKVEAGTGYFKTSWSGGEIKPEMADVQLVKTNKGVSWGALYWQYFEQLDKITPHETPLKLNKTLFVERITERGAIIEPIDKETKLVVGDKVKVRIELRVDRAMEYVHLKDMRASGFEPINVLSRYKYQDGLGYYESTRDAATNFFIGYLPKGTYVFEYELRATHKGDFSNGITTIQCMYAPEFTSHSEGIRVDIEAQK